MGDVVVMKVWQEDRSLKRAEAEELLPHKPIVTRKIAAEESPTEKMERDLQSVLDEIFASKDPFHISPGDY